MFRIEYFDSTTSLNLYALLIDSQARAYNPTTKAFASYNDSSISNFNLNMTEEAARLKHYTYNITGVTIAADTYTVEIYRQIGGSPSKTADVLKAVSPFYWNGSGQMDVLATPRISDGYWLGQPHVGDTLFFDFNIYDKFGNLANADSTPAYKIYHNTTNLITGAATNRTTGQYYVSLSVGTGTYVAGEYYEIELSASINGVSAGSSRGFQVYSTTAITTAISGSLDVTNSLGYSSGFILSALSTSGYYTTLYGNVNKQFNGGIMVANSGPLKGQARIIYNTNISGYMQSNKGFTSQLTSGVYFLVMPIGGELNN